MITYTYTAKNTDGTCFVVVATGLQHAADLINDSLSYGESYVHVSDIKLVTEFKVFREEFE